MKSFIFSIRSRGLGVPNERVCDSQDEESGIRFVPDAGLPFPSKLRVTLRTILHTRYLTQKRSLVRHSLQASRESRRRNICKRSAIVFSSRLPDALVQRSELAVQIIAEYCSFVRCAKLGFVLLHYGDEWHDGDKRVDRAYNSTPCSSGRVNNAVHLL